MDQDNYSITDSYMFGMSDLAKRKRAERDAAFNGITSFAKGVFAFAVCALIVATVWILAAELGKHDRASSREKSMEPRPVYDVRWHYSDIPVSKRHRAILPKDKITR